MTRVLMASELLSPALAASVRAARHAAGRARRAPDDSEAIHDLRVGIRRARTVLAAGRKLYGRKLADGLIDELRAVSKATNALRDEEVLGETIAQAELDAAMRVAARAWIERRVALLGELRALSLEVLGGPRLDGLLDAVAELAEKPLRRDLGAAELAHAELLRARRELCAALPAVRAEDSRELHRLRIRFKRLRYLAEMLGGALRDATPAPAGAALSESGWQAERYPAIAKHAAGFQKELGLVHDLDVALATARATRDLDQPIRAALVDSLDRARQRLAHEAMDRLIGELAHVIWGPQQR